MTSRAARSGGSRGAQLRPFSQLNIARESRDYPTSREKSSTGTERRFSASRAPFSMASTAPLEGNYKLGWPWYVNGQNHTGFSSFAIHYVDGGYTNPRNQQRVRSRPLRCLGMTAECAAIYNGCLDLPYRETIIHSLLVSMMAHKVAPVTYCLNYPFMSTSWSLPQNPLCNQNQAYASETQTTPVLRLNLRAATSVTRSAPRAFFAFPGYHAVADWQRVPIPYRVARAD
jgi:hypothetical protein